MWTLVGIIVGVAIIVACYLVQDPIPRLDISKCKVIVTGGSSGIGKAVAYMLLQRGASVGIMARNRHKLELVADELHDARISSNQRVVCADGDVGDYHSCCQAIDELAEGLGGVDIIIHSAGISLPGRFEDISPENFEKLIQVNYLGSVYVAQAILPHLREQNGGRIVFVSSLAGLSSVQGLLAYSPTKFAVRGLAEGLHMELRPEKIYCSVVNPPDVDTPMYREEMKVKPEECRLISEGSGLFTADQIAKDIIDGIVDYKFFISSGFDGILSGSLCAGMAPAAGLGVTILETFFLGIVRLVGLFYLRAFNQICDDGYRKRMQ